MNRKLKLTVAAVMTTAVATFGITTAAIADDGSADSKSRSLCC